MTTKTFLTNKFKTAFFDAIRDLNLEHTELEQSLFFIYKNKEIHALINVYIEDNLEVYMDSFIICIVLHKLEIEHETIDKQQGELLELDYKQIIKFLES